MESVSFQFTYYSIEKLPLALLKTVQISTTRERLCLPVDQEGCQKLMQKHTVVVKKDQKLQNRNDFIRQKSWKLLSVLMALTHFDGDQELFKILKKIDGQEYITYENDTVGFNASSFLKKIEEAKKEHQKKLVNYSKNKDRNVIFLSIAITSMLCVFLYCLYKKIIISYL